jgi:hypothetical protein
MQIRTIFLSLLMSLPCIATASVVPSDAFRVMPGFEPQDILQTQQQPVLPILAELPVDPAEEAASRLVGLTKNLSLDVARRAMQSAYCAQEHGLVVEKVVVVDMGMKASQKRLWAFDIKDASNWRLVLNERVTHGSGSDPDADGKAQRFSNEPDSHMTSLGLYRIAERYEGKHGISRRLDGLFQRFNSNARERAVVLHPSDYVNPDRVGRSQGCPAVNPKTMETLEKAGLGKAVLWMDAPDKALAKEVADCSKKKREAILAQRMEKWEHDTMLALATRQNALMALDTYMPSSMGLLAYGPDHALPMSEAPFACPLTLGALYPACSVFDFPPPTYSLMGERA